MKRNFFHTVNLFGIVYLHIANWLILVIVRLFFCVRQNPESSVDFIYQCGKANETELCLAHASVHKGNALYRILSGSFKRNDYILVGFKKYVAI